MCSAASITPVMPYAAVSSEESYVISCEERAKIYANRVMYSRVYAIVYAAALLASLCLLLWVIIESHVRSQRYIRSHLWVFVAADSVVTAVVILEISVAVVGQGWVRYRQSVSNVIDVFVAIFCVFVILLHAFGPAFTVELETVTGLKEAALANDLEEEEIEQEEVETGVLVLRYAAQISRLYVMLRHFRRQQESCMRTREMELDLDAADCGSGPPTPKMEVTLGGIDLPEWRAEDQRVDPDEGDGGVEAPEAQHDEQAADDGGECITPPPPGSCELGANRSEE